MLDQIPAGSLLYRDLPQGAYVDACILPLGDLPAPVLGTLVPAFFQSAPAWFLWLFRLRNRLVAPLGLRTGQFADDGLAPPYAPGGYIGVFRIIAVTEREIVFGEDDRHLDFRTSLMLRDGQVAISTWVREHNLLGRVYFFIVKPFHRLIVPVMGRRMMRALRAQAGLA